jgi:NAD(P)H dehydrogenase (quinone)
VTKTVLLVHAHPETDSFSTAQSDAAARALTAAGHAVDVIDLYADTWQPVLRREDFPDVDGAFKPQAEQMRAVADGTVDDVVRDQLDRLLAADLLVLSFPMWWFSVPAILKGWIDRVFVMGAVFGGEHGLFDEAALARKDAVLLMTTGGAFGPMDDFVFHIRRGMLEFVGYRVLDPVVTYGPARLDAHERDVALRAVHGEFAQIAEDLTQRGAPAVPA